MLQTVHNTNVIMLTLFLDPYLIQFFQFQFNVINTIQIFQKTALSIHLTQILNFM